MSDALGSSTQHDHWLFDLPVEALEAQDWPVSPHVAGQPDQAGSAPVLSCSEWIPALHQSPRQSVAASAPDLEDSFLAQLDDQLNSKGTDWQPLHPSTSTQPLLQQSHHGNLQSHSNTGLHQNIRVSAQPLQPAIYTSAPGKQAGMPASGQPLMHGGDVQGAYTPTSPAALVHGGHGVCRVAAHSMAHGSCRSSCRPAPGPSGLRPASSSPLPSAKRPCLTLSSEISTGTAACPEWPDRRDQAMHIFNFPDAPGELRPTAHRIHSYQKYTMSRRLRPTACKSCLRHYATAQLLC